jgi:hypothetical protein
MLCSPSISVWSAQKHDPEAAEEIAVLHGARVDGGRYNNSLFPRKALEETQE